MSSKRKIFLKIKEILTFRLQKLFKSRWMSREFCLENDSTIYFNEKKSKILEKLKKPRRKKRLRIGFKVRVYRPVFAGCSRADEWGYILNIN